MKTDTFPAGPSVFTHLGLRSLEQDVVVGRRWGRMFPQQSALWKFIINLLGDWNIGQQHELLHHGVGLPNNQETRFLTYKSKTHTEKNKKDFSFSKGTYMSSLVWRSMGSWVSLSMWKRTSKDDSVNALKDIEGQIILNTATLNISYWNQDDINCVCCFFPQYFWLLF